MLLRDFLDSKLSDKSDLAELFLYLFESVKKISESIDITKSKTDQLNESGDTQLEMDVLADMIMHDTLMSYSGLSLLASEERSETVIFNGDKFSVVYDPLDGSSLIDANFAIGTIIGVFPGTNIEGRTARDMSAAMMAVYGPRTSVVLSFGQGVYEFLLKETGFELVKSDVKIKQDGKYFAPGNLRACTSNKAYKKLVDYWIDNQYTLRYSGGMVPDINHIFTKGEGIFAYPKSEDMPEGKLRLLYECGPMAYLVENAGGKATNGYTNILDIPIKDLHQKTPILIGSKAQVDLAMQFEV